MSARYTVIIHGKNDPPANEAARSARYDYVLRQPASQNIEGVASGIDRCANNRPNVSSGARFTYSVGSSPTTIIDGRTK